MAKLRWQEAHVKVGIQNEEKWKFLRIVGRSWGKAHVFPGHLAKVALFLIWVKITTF
jgi:hypothetical protein